jgi:hypothetical protein
VRGLSRKEKQERINQNVSKIKGYKRDWNCVKFNPASSKIHEMKKAEVCFEALCKGFDFLTEVEFVRGGRGDIYIPEVDTVFEILHSETKKRFDSKNYPVKRVIAVRTDEEVKI